MGIPESSARVGLLYGLIAYGVWGVVPLYFKAIKAVSPDEILAHRVIWSAVLLFLLVWSIGRLSDLWKCFRSPSILGRLTLSSLLVGTNWYAFIYSVVTNQIVQGSLGYFILPLVNVAIGMIFFGERMRWPQRFALGLATCGVVNMIYQLGVVPWIALTVAFSFGFYGVVRKQTPVDGTIGLTVETILLSPIGIVYLIFLSSRSQMAFGSIDTAIDALIIFSGVVTSVPLICYAEAVRRLKLITIGFLQYISPSLAFSLAVLKYDEEFTSVHQISFGLIWSGLVIFLADVLWNRRAKL